MRLREAETLTVQVLQDVGEAKVPAHGGNDLSDAGEDDADEREDYELRNDEEREVSCHDRAVESRARGRALVLGQLAHGNGKEVSENGADGGRQHRGR